jgi:RNA polymerase sigma-70 factor (ECF subfamily)
MEALAPLESPLESSLQEDAQSHDNHGHWPHKPHDRHSLPLIGLEAENWEEIGSNLPRPFQRALWNADEPANDPVPNQAPLRGCPVNDPTSLEDLAASATDEELLARYQHDDADALAAIRSRYIDDLLAHAGRRLGARSRDHADDIVQQAFLNFHKHRKEYPPQTCIPALLFKIVRRFSDMHLRYVTAKKRDRRLTCGLRESDADSKADPSKHAERMDIDEALGTLPADQADAIRLLRIDGHSLESAGELLGVPPKTVHKRAERGINTLRERASTNDAAGINDRTNDRANDGTDDSGCQRPQFRLRRADCPALEVGQPLPDRPGQEPRPGNQDVRGPCPPPS